MLLAEEIIMLMSIDDYVNTNEVDGWCGYERQWVFRSVFFFSTFVLSFRNVKRAPKNFC